VNKAKQASVEFALRWQSAEATHVERLYYEKVNFWRDFFPGALGDRLAVLPPGKGDAQSFTAGTLVAAHDRHLVYRIRPAQLNLKLRTGQTIPARSGRFYPRGMIRGLPDVFSGDRRPFRYLGEDGDRLRVDLNHPLARYPLTVEAAVVEVHGVQAEHGGRSHDVVHDLTENGPGMQAADPGVATDFYAEEPFARIDDRDDALFYRQPRLVQHLDSAARRRVTEIYARFLAPGMQVLDLMSSWVSHLPEAPDLHVTGLGLNSDELGKNPRLAERRVHDLNTEPRLPFKDKQFDAVVCTASVEYLVRPFEVFREVARVLRPGAPFVLTFSERWFPPKVVQVWTELHPFERLGLVLDYFRQSGGFGDLHTETIRGLPRPADDPYADTLALSDPVYAVWGKKP
jgi:SAM-dependent methyltransferase